MSKFQLPKINISEDTKQRVVTAAIMGAAIGLFIPSRRKSEEAIIEIEDLQEAKILINNIETVCEGVTRNYLAGRVDEEDLAMEMDIAIASTSDGKIKDREHFQAYKEFYKELVGEV